MQSRRHRYGGRPRAARPASGERRAPWRRRERRWRRASSCSSCLRTAHPASADATRPRSAAGMPRRVRGVRTVELDHLCVDAFLVWKQSQQVFGSVRSTASVRKRTCDVHADERLGVDVVDRVHGPLAALTHVARSACSHRPLSAIPRPMVLRCRQRCRCITAIRSHAESIERDGLLASDRSHADSTRSGWESN